MPSDITLDQAASLPLGLATAAAGLYNERASDSGAKKLIPPWEAGKNLYGGQPILIFGGSSSVGQYSES